MHWERESSNRAMVLIWKDPIKNEQGRSTSSWSGDSFAHTS